MEVVISAGETSAQFMVSINRSGAEFPNYISKQCAEFSIPVPSGGKLEGDVIGHIHKTEHKKMHKKIIRWFMVGASIPTKLHYLYVLLCVHFLHFQYTTNTELYTFHSTDVTLGGNQCCFSEANVTTTSCNVEVSDLNTSTTGMHTISLMLNSTDHNLVCNQSLLTVKFSKFIMIVCRIQWNLSILDTIGCVLLRGCTVYVCTSVSIIIYVHIQYIPIRTYVQGMSRSAFICIGS